jgi:exodeoxyribonuclease VII small subunit
MNPLTSPEEMNYEDAVRELEAVIAALETAQISLEESLLLYERGQSLAARCAALLDQAELRLKTLTPGGEGAG